MIKAGIKLSAAVVACVCVGCIGNASATELGMTSYPLGVNTLLGGTYPAPGTTWFENYFQVYRATSFTNASGANAVPGFQANVVVDSLRFVHGWDLRIGPFGLASTLSAPVIDANVRTMFSSQNRIGVGNIALEPIDLTWSLAGGAVVGYATAIAFVPTGSNVSNNFYSFTPLVAATWFPNRDVDVSLTVGTEFHTTNSTTSYRSGSLAFLEYGIDWHAFKSVPKLMIGMGGYAATQFSDDTVKGVSVQDGMRQQVVSIGPQITYGGENGGVSLKWQHEFVAKNRPAGDRIWVQALIPF
ncbi:hypothetical protein LMG24238_07650 [Paraburkholderia sediminicola]|uniref:Phenol degradation protein meta n=1 Tax=Paraburkholderia sediminicola TaxID=458836 RepID=A0A6J5CWK3_9BURK|nr:transporter [Paraburkholderia sediminicola]CAB3745520.1 hypothetical protein LMG24238_07650 [Paraburkholderia sediminicola]